MRRSAWPAPPRRPPKVEFAGRPRSPWRPRTARALLAVTLLAIFSLGLLVAAICLAIPLST